MSEKAAMPSFTMVAGPNGSGKSSFSLYLRNLGLISTNPINLDELLSRLDFSHIPHDPHRYQKLVYKELDKTFTGLCEKAIQEGGDFSYECNYRKEQINHVALFDQAEYKLRLIFFWIDSIDISIARVNKRVAEGGHFVGEKMIRKNFTEGLNNLNMSWADWDELYIIDNSKDIDMKKEKSFSLFLYAEKGEIIFRADKEKPEFEKYLPDISFSSP